MTSFPSAVPWVLPNVKSPRNERSRNRSVGSSPPTTTQYPSGTALPRSYDWQPPSMSSYLPTQYSRVSYTQLRHVTRQTVTLPFPHSPMCNADMSMAPPQPKGCRHSASLNSPKSLHSLGLSGANCQEHHHRLAGTKGGGHRLPSLLASRRRQAAPLYIVRAMPTFYRAR
jgi:hypothetical protein